MTRTSILAAAVLISLIGCGSGGDGGSSGDGGAGSGGPNGAPAGSAHAIAVAQKPGAASSASSAGSAIPVTPGTASATQLSAAEDAVRGFYAPYLEGLSDDRDPGALGRPIYTAAMTRVIAAWRAGNPGPEPTAATDADWICGCQDWDAANARVTLVPARANDDGSVLVTAAFNPGFDAQPQPVEFIMRREGGQWLVDDARLRAGSTLRRLLTAETRNPGR